MRFGPAVRGSPERRPAMRVLLVAENISLRLSGETLVSWYHLDGLRRLGVDVRAICHARVRDELREDLDPATFARITFVEDGWLQRAIFAFGRRFPYRIEDLIFNQLIHILTQIRMRRIVKRLIHDHRIDVVYEPAPIAPRALSFLFGLRAPVVIGPMSGGMDLPPAFRDMDGAPVRAAIGVARALASLLHVVVPGKRNADALIVGNEQTRRALPPGVRGRVHLVAESGVALDRWTPRNYAEATPAGPVKFIFCSRFVDWKGIGFLVEAFVPLARAGGAHLDLVGDGELFEEIRRQIASAGVGHAVTLHGRLPLEDYVALLRETDVFVTPSLRECGGMAMLEAMAIGLPVIGVAWGGAAQYTTPECAILVEPASERALIEGLRDAMRRMAASYRLRRAFGEAARRHLAAERLGWTEKTAMIADILADVVDRQRPSADPADVRRRDTLAVPSGAAPSPDRLPPMRVPA